MFTFWLILTFHLVSLSLQQCCLTFVGLTKKCASCPAGSHLFRNNCITDIDNCLAYADGFDCSECKSGYVVFNGECQLSQNNPPLNGLQFTDQYFQEKDLTDSLLILADYSRSLESKIEKAQILWGTVRTYKNGTVHTIVSYQTQNKNYYESIAQFDKTNIFLFKVLQIRKLNDRPEKIIPGDVDNNENDINKTSSNNNNTVIPNKTNPIQNRTGLANLNYVYLNYEQRKKDAGFLSVDQLVRSVNVQQLGEAAIVLAAYYQKKGFNTQYIVYYQSSDKKSIYENKSIYQLLRKRSMITSFYRTNIK